MPRSVAASLSVHGAVQEEEGGGRASPSRGAQRRQDGYWGPAVPGGRARAVGRMDRCVWSA